MAKGICSIEDCDMPVVCRGWCSRHYARWRTHGDPLGGGASRGAPLQWLARLIEEAVASEEDSCRTGWPYTRVDGYPQVYWQGKARRAHAVVLELTGRPQPTPAHVGRHLCGKGHLGCLHPRHLAWGTVKDNAADAIAHGTQTRGERAGRAKLTEADVRAIRASTDSYSVMAKRYGLAISTFTKIRNRESWKHLAD